MWCSWGIEGHKLFQVFFKYLGDIDNLMRLRNIGGNLGKAKFDRTHYKFL